VADKADVAN
jgi:hypothetical protein